MRFKVVFILLNALLAAFFAALLVSPAFLFAGAPEGFFSKAVFFWKDDWFLLLIPLLILAGFDVFFVFRWRFFTLLEREDWPALIRYLEDMVLGRGKYRPSLVRLLASSYLVLSDSAAVMSLEKKCAAVKPRVVDDNVLVFGAARILGRDILGAVRFFESRLSGVRPALRPWVRWYYGFSLFLNRCQSLAAKEFLILVRESSGAVVTALAACLLCGPIAAALPMRREEFEEAAARGRERVREKIPLRKDWDREIGRIKIEIHAALISKYLEEAGSQIYNFPAPVPAHGGGDEEKKEKEGKKDINENL